MSAPKQRIHGHCQVEVSDVAIGAYDDNTGKPYLILKFVGAPAIAITTNIAEMIGGIGKGTRERWEGKDNASGKVH